MRSRGIARMGRSCRSRARTEVSSKWNRKQIGILKQENHRLSLAASWRLGERRQWQEQGARVWRALAMSLAKGDGAEGWHLWGRTAVLTFGHIFQRNPTEFHLGLDIKCDSHCVFKDNSLQAGGMELSRTEGRGGRQCWRPKPTPNANLLKRMKVKQTHLCLGVGRHELSADGVGLRVGTLQYAGLLLKSWGASEVWEVCWRNVLAFWICSS